MQKGKAQIRVMTKKEAVGEAFEQFIDEMTIYTDAGGTLPKTYLFFNQRAANLSGVINKEQLKSLTDMELEFVDDDKNIIVVASKE